MDTYRPFDFGLSSEQETRAETLHDENVIIDLHWQGPCSPSVWTEELVAEVQQELPSGTDELDFTWWFLKEKALRGEFPLFEERYRTAGATTDMVACELSDESHVLKAANRAARLANSLESTRRARSASDIRAAKAANGIALWGVCAFNGLRPGDLHLVEVAHELGVLDVCELAYNRMNFIAGGCTERYDPGLSYFGLEFIRRCNEVGVIIDTSHTGRQSTLDACEVSKQPVVATHTSAARLYECDRAKSDEELRALAATGGVIGVYAIPFFLSPAAESDQTINLVLDHIDYIVELVGWEHVAIGTDWPLALPLETQRRLVMPLFEASGFRAEHHMDVEVTLEGFRDPIDLRNITRGLVGRGYRDEQVRGIMGGNFLRVFEEVCG